MFFFAYFHFFSYVAHVAGLASVAAVYEKALQSQSAYISISYDLQFGLDRVQVVFVRQFLAGFQHSSQPVRTYHIRHLADFCVLLQFPTHLLIRSVPALSIPSEQGHCNSGT